MYIECQGLTLRTRLNLDMLLCSSTFLIGIDKLVLLGSTHCCAYT